MDILETEREKKILRLSIGIARKKFGKRASVENIHNELANHKSQAVQNIFQVITLIHDGTPESLTWQRMMISELGEFALWCLIHHPEYSRVFACMSKTMFSDDRIDFNDKWLFNKIDTYLASLILEYAYKKLYESAHFQHCKDEITIFSDPAAKYIYTNICNAVDVANIKDQEELKLFAAMLLWIVTHDTAYSDVFYWGIYQLGNTNTKKITAIHYIPLNKCYMVNFHKGNELTKKLRKEGVISQYDKALPNKYCVHSERRAQLQRIIKKGEKHTRT